MPSLPDIPDILTQDLVDADPALKRLQQDLLILTSFRDNETLHWRPSWFPQGGFATKWWTLHNPPDVVTEILPAPEFGHKVYTRRMRRAEDPMPLYIKTWEQWRMYCAFYGVPEDFLDRKMVELLRLGLPRDKEGNLCGKSFKFDFTTLFLWEVMLIFCRSSASTTHVPGAQSTGQEYLHPGSIDA